VLRIQIMSDTHGGTRTHSIDHAEVEARAFNEVLKLLRDLPDDLRSFIFADDFDVVPHEWESPGLDSRQAQELSARLRSEAFAFESTGEVPVRLVMYDDDDEQSSQLPDIVVTLSAMLEHLAARLGPGQRVCFGVEGES
jgi:hypothetical protein